MKMPMASCKSSFQKGVIFLQSVINPWAVGATVLNHRPRKRLQFRSPAEILAKIPGVALQL